MKTSILSATALLLVAVCSTAQQPNQPGASMRIDGGDGPPFPLAATIQPGIGSVMVLGGGPNMPALLAEATALAPSGVPVLGTQLVDLDIGTVRAIWGDLQAPYSRLDSAGQLSIPLEVPNGAMPGVLACYQALVVDAGAPQGASLSAATEVSVGNGIVSIPLTLQGFERVAIDLSSYGMTALFYGQHYTRLWISPEGLIEFGPGYVDFLSSPASFMTRAPRIAMFWSDLTPELSGTVTAAFDLSSGVPSFAVTFENVREMGFASPNTFGARIWGFPVGDIEIWQDAYNPGGNYPTLVGITPGYNRSPVGVRDLSYLTTHPVQGGTDEAFFEWFGNPSMPSWPSPTANPWDLSGRTLAFTPTDPIHPRSYFAFAW